MKDKISFAITVRFDPDSGIIQIARPTGTRFCASISTDPASRHCHPQLYRALAMALHDAGAEHPQTLPKPN